jgi:hypothetical protein
MEDPPQAATAIITAVECRAHLRYSDAGTIAVLRMK